MEDALIGMPTDVKQSESRILETLINWGISCKDKNLDGMSPLHTAAYAGKFNILRLLLLNLIDNEGPINIVDGKLYNVLDEAVNGLVEHIQLRNTTGGTLPVMFDTRNSTTKG